MNDLSKPLLSACAALLAGMILSGCVSSSTTPLFSDNPSPPGTAASPASPTTPVSANAASLSAGETVTVDMTTGSENVQGPTDEYLINENGTITLPLVGAVQAAGKTPGELQNEIHDLYVPKYYVRLTVTLKSQRRVYYVGGEVRAPGAQVYLGQTTVSEAIQAAGDFTNFANHTVWLTHTDGTRIKVNVDQALRDPAKDLAVFPGDQIFVKRRIF
jgi:protein involved in polysaccharide export with SLBB domain